MQVTWANPQQTALLISFGKYWTRADFWQMCQQAYQMTASAKQTVNIIVDLSVSYTTPHNIIYLVLSGMRMRTDNVGKVVVISESQLWINLYHYMRRAYPLDVCKVEFVSGFHEAAQVLDTSFFVDGTTAHATQQGHTVAPFSASA